MRAGRSLVYVIVLGAAVAAAAMSVTSHTASNGPLIDVPGIAARNLGGYAAVNEVSCSSAGNCAAGGGYHDRSRTEHAFMVDERDGAWGGAVELSLQGSARVSLVSCPSRGNCAAGGTVYQRPFVVDERDGVWGKPIVLPLLRRHKAYLVAISCAKAGWCEAGGFYNWGATFVVHERHGVWRKPIKVPGAATIGHQAMVNSISCATANFCALDGTYVTYGPGKWGGFGKVREFVAEQRNGVWGTATRVRGGPTFNKSGGVHVASISCPRAGFCTTAGNYAPSLGSEQVFAASERNGVWGKAIDVPGYAALNVRRGTSPWAGYNPWPVTSLSCAKADSCAIGGFYFDGAGRGQAFVAEEKGGVWKHAIEVPGSEALNVGGDAKVTSISCPSPGNCVAGGSYSGAKGVEKAFVVSERNGAWGMATKVPGWKTLNVGNTYRDFGIEGIACAGAHSCVIGGWYKDRDGHFQAFVGSP